MSAGFYKRRRGILEHLEAGTISLLDLAIHDYLCLKINSVRGSACSIPAGVCFTSAAAIYAICPKEVSERTIRRSLEHLERIHWIKRWTVPGKHGNYPVLIARASVHDLSGIEYRVNAEETTDWRFPVYVPGEELASRRRGAREELSADKEVRIERPEGINTPAARPTPPADPRHKPFFDYAYEAYRSMHGQPPTWAGKEGKVLQAFLQVHHHITADEWQRRFDNYLASTEAFVQKQGCSLAYFISHFDTFSNGPILERGSNGNQSAAAVKPSQVSTQTLSPFEQQRPDCQECRGTGWAMKGGKATLCVCAIERKVRAAIPEQYWRAKLEDFSWSAHELVMGWLFNPSDGLFITGACGTGKTHLAAGIVRNLILKRTDVAFKRSADFYREVREMFKEHSEGGEAGVMSRVERVCFLVFDDLGAGSLSDCERRYTLELIDNRLNKIRPTVVTSNWGLQEIAERMDDRIASRLAGFTALELSGSDRRIKP